MKVLLKRVGQPYEFEEIENTLEAMQAVVGGHIEVVRLNGGRLLICDENGWFNEESVNTFVKTTGSIEQILGDFFVCRAKDEDFIGIDPDLSLNALVRAVDAGAARGHVAGN